MRCVIVGGGIAGTTVAEVVRAESPDAEITLVAEERGPLYSRVLLPHYAKGRIARAKCFLKPLGWYEANGIRLLDGTIGVALDSERRVLTLEDGRELAYDVLVLAPSGRARTFPQPLRGVSYLRTLTDADHLLELLAEFEALPSDARHAAIVGGSFIAVEFINIFVERRIAADLFLFGAQFFGAALDTESFALLRDRVEAAGIRVHADTPVETLQHTALAASGTNDAAVGATRSVSAHAGALAGLTTVAGVAYDATMLGVGIGLVPQLDWLRRAGIVTNTGIVTNEYLETNVPGVYACGDVAEFEDVIVGRRVQVGNWLNAQTHGRVVGKTISGQRSRVEFVSSYATNICGLDVIFVGDTTRDAADVVIARGSRTDGGVMQCFLRDERMVGATLLNRNPLRTPITEVIRSRRAVDPDRLADPAVPFPF